jgi:serine acetyltransferase
VTAPNPETAGPAPAKPLHRRVANRILHLLARFAPGATSLRPWLHRMRGVRVGAGVFIGEDVYVDNEHPEAIEIGERVQISIRAVIIAHTRGAGRVIIGKEAFVGPGAILVCGANRVLKIGEGAVIGAGSVVTRSVPPRLYVAPAAPQPMARVRVPLPAAKTMDEFAAGLEPLPQQKRSD